MLNKFINFFKLIYNKLIKIDDSPHKIALGFGLGVFTGIMPGIGPLIALALAYIFHANKASALIGSFFTNTWVSLLILAASVKLSSNFFGLNLTQIYNDWRQIITKFDFSKFSAQYKLIISVALGYLIISIILGLIAYIISLIVVRLVRREKVSLKAVII